MVSAIGTFISLFVVFTGLAIATPFLHDFFGEPADTGEIDKINELATESSGLTVATNIFVMFFWTFGLANVFNFILIPFRIIALISLYYIIFPTK